MWRWLCWCSGSSRDGDVCGLASSGLLIAVGTNQESVPLEHFGVVVVGCAENVSSRILFVGVGIVVDGREVIALAITEDRYL